MSINLEEFLDDIQSAYAYLVALEGKIMRGGIQEYAAARMLLKIRLEEVGRNLEEPE